MSSNKEKDKGEDRKKREESRERQWYGAQPTMNYLYRLHNTPGRGFAGGMGANGPYPGYREWYDPRSGKNRISGPVAEEVRPRLRSAGNKLRSVRRAMVGAEAGGAAYEFGLPDMPYGEALYGRMPRPSEKVSETLGPYIMRPPAYGERRRVFNSPRPEEGGAFMPYHGTSVAPPDTVTSFADGMKLFAGRMSNDARYFRGNAVSKYFDEAGFIDNIGGIMLRSEKQGKTLFDLSRADMLKMRNEILSEKRRLGQVGAQDAVLQGRTPEEYAASLDGQIAVLGNLIKAKDTFTSPGKYEDYVRSIYRSGGRGMEIRREANTARERMPVAKGWAMAGDIMSSVVQNAAPLALRMVSPWLGAASLVGTLSATANSSMAEAAMELDSYEKATGKKIDGARRNAYVFGVGATDLLVDAMMQRFFFKNASMHSVMNFRNSILKNLVATKGGMEEMELLVNKLALSRGKQLALAGKNILAASSMQATSEASQSVMRDMLTTIYRNPEHFPTLTNIIANAAANAGIGFFAGGVMDVLSRRPALLFGQGRNSSGGKLIFLSDVRGRLLHYLGTDKKTGLLKVSDMSGNHGWIDLGSVVKAREFDFADYYAMKKIRENPFVDTPQEYYENGNLPYGIKYRGLGARPVFELPAFRAFKKSSARRGVAEAAPSDIRAERLLSGDVDRMIPETELPSPPGAGRMNTAWLDRIFRPRRKAGGNAGQDGPAEVSGTDLSDIDIESLLPADLDRMITESELSSPSGAGLADPAELDRIFRTRGKAGGNAGQDGPADVSGTDLSDIDIESLLPADLDRMITESELSSPSGAGLADPAELDRIFRPRGKAGNDAVQENPPVLPDDREMNLVNSNRVYRFNEDLDDIIDRGVEGQIYYDDPTETFVDREYLAPIREDVSYPYDRPLAQFRPGRHGSQRNAYRDAPFLSGDELTWRMFNPEDGDKWLENNPFFEDTGPGTKHNYAIETPVKSPYRPFFYRDNNISDKEYEEMLKEWMNGQGYYPGLPGYMRPEGDIPYYGGLDDDYDYRLKDLYLALEDPEGAWNRAVKPIGMLKVNGERRKPLYRTEMGLVQNIPDIISPYEDMLLQAKEMASRLRLRTRLYKTLGDVPEKLRNKLGIDDTTASFYNPNNKEIGIIMEKSGLWDIRSALLKFGVIERGLKGVFGRQTDKLLREIYRRIPPEYKRYYYEEYRSLEEGAAAYLVDVATNPNLDSTAWDEFSSMARLYLLEKYGMGEITDMDLRYILWQAVNRIREDDSIVEMQRKNKRMNRRLGKRGDDSHSPQDGGKKTR